MSILVLDALAAVGALALTLGLRLYREWEAAHALRKMEIIHVRRIGTELYGLTRGGELIRRPEKERIEYWRAMLRKKGDSCSGKSASSS